MKTDEKSTHELALSQLGELNEELKSQQRRHTIWLEAKNSNVVSGNKKPSYDLVLLKLEELNKELKNFKKISAICFVVSCFAIICLFVFFFG